MRSLVLVSAIAALASFASNAQELAGMAPAPDAEYSPYIQQDFPNQVLFGDTHLHTGYSADAGLVGATTTPDDAEFFGIKLPDDIAPSHQERAYTSPIWYTP